MKKISILFLSLIVLITLTACDMVDKSSDAYRFKEEYESINGEENGHGNKNRSLEIPIDNPMIYASTDEIIEKMNNKESFVVYFGFASCPWCRSMVESLIQSAKDHNIDTIYYVDVLNIRDRYQLDEEGNLQKTSEGTDGYKALIEKLENVLSDYNLKNEDGEEISTGEKRIYAPNVVAVVNGKAEKMTEGISEKLVDPYSKLTEEMLDESYNSFNCLWDCIENGSNICQKNMC